jgi:hypothetical protein
VNGRRRLAGLISEDVFFVNFMVENYSWGKIGISNARGGMISRRCVAAVITVATRWVDGRVGGTAQA